MSLDIDCKMLIDEVKKRTPLFDTSIKAYHNRKLKKQLWNEVFKEVCSPSVWDSMSGQDKIIYEKEIQKKWTSFRHCFRREIVAQKTIPAGSTAKKKRKYLYYDSLSFLLPFTEFVNTEGSLENSENEVNTLENKRDKARKEESNARTVQKNNDEEIINLPIKENQMLCNLKTHDNGPDEDELFLRSLVPYMKEFSGDQKLLLRMEIMKSILNFKQSLNQSSRHSQGNVKNET